MSSPSDRHRRLNRPVSVLAIVGAASMLVLGACTGEEAIPIDPANPPTTAPDLTDVTHVIEPTDQMRAEAERQCEDDPDLAQGYVRAVDPETDEILTEFTVDCAKLRGDG